MIVAMAVIRVELVQKKIRVYSMVYMIDLSIKNIQEVALIQ
jgi:hypothetical protein